MITYEKYNALRDDMPENIEELYILFDFIELKNTFFYHKKKCYFEIDKKRKHIYLNRRFVNGVYAKSKTNNTLDRYSLNDIDYKEFANDIRTKYKIEDYFISTSDFSYVEKILKNVKR